MKENVTFISEEYGRTRDGIATQLGKEVYAFAGETWSGKLLITEKGGLTV